jgi:hypothetical protein
MKGEIFSKPIGNVRYIAIKTKNKNKKEIPTSKKVKKDKRKDFFYLKSAMSNKKGENGGHIGSNTGNISSC